MKLYHIVAMSENRVIGKKNQLPWHFPADLKHFKNLTMGSTIIMGRKTFESIGKPLPGRENFVLSRRRKPASAHGAERVYFFLSLENALEKVKTEKTFIIGGADLFQQTMYLVDGIYLTKIGGKYEGDAFYPEITKEFKEISRTPCPEDPNLEFIYYERA